MRNLAYYKGGIIRMQAAYRETGRREFALAARYAARWVRLIEKCVLLNKNDAEI